MATIYDIAQNVPITVRANNDWAPSWHLKKADGTELDTTGYSFVFVVRDGLGTEVMRVTVFTRTGAVVPSTISFTRSKAQMNILPGLYKYQLTAIYPDGTEHAWFEKPFIINENNA